MGELARQVSIFGSAVAHFWHVGALVLAAAAMVPLNPLNPLEVDSHTVYIQLARKRVLHGHSGFQRLDLFGGVSCMSEATMRKVRETCFCQGQKNDVKSGYRLPCIIPQP